MADRQPNTRSLPDGSIDATNSTPQAAIDNVRTRSIPQSYSANEVQEWPEAAIAGQDDNAPASVHDSDDDDDDQSVASDSDVRDFDQWVYATIDIYTNDWNIPDSKRASVKHLSAELWIDLEYEPEQERFRETPEIGLNTVRIFGAQAGNAEILSLVEEFPGLQTLMLEFYCVQDPFNLPDSAVSVGNLRSVIQRILAQLLAHEMRWTEEVELRTTFTYQGIMAYTVLNEPGDSMVLGIIAAEGSD
ncbi:hypothetical protein LTR08_001520 [Meristemomyces frigidus]|nr:hypothetical protein LTR08_001520 [Meristemomyces frigidus]